FFKALQYRIVEPFAVLESRQRAALAGYGSRFTWRNSLAELDGFCGVHFSNELIDAMPVHVVRWTGSEWMERHVSVSGESFAFTDAPISNCALAARLREIPQPLPDGYQTEVNLAALHWIESVAAKVKRGFIVAVDYGHPRDLYYAAERRTGTLQCYAKHRVVPSPLTQPGRSDITAHVEWTTLAQHAESLGLTLVGFTDQHHFITGLLMGEIGREFEGAADAQARRALQTLLQPTLLGMAFQFLVLGKDADEDVQLAGLRFARDRRAVLGLP
ncbi:MAG TPA: class I SAM-dependent methyltransferase, partial [Chthoniobacterales bacterium]|nr:class I SAM-dependent methyltransferase [Chthoniobacterales bacterium]